MRYWLMKSEPDVWSIDQQKKAGIKGAPWGWCQKLSSCKEFKKYEERRSMFFFIIQI